MEIHAIKCKVCNNTIFSRARHDLRTCECGNVSIDGGFDYIKISVGDGGYNPVKLTLNKVTKEILYDDWNKSKDKYGVIK